MPTLNNGTLHSGFPGLYIVANKVANATMQKHTHARARANEQAHLSAFFCSGLPATLTLRRRVDLPFPFSVGFACLAWGHVWSAAHGDDGITLMFQAPTGIIALYATRCRRRLNTNKIIKLPRRDYFGEIAVHPRRHVKMNSVYVGGGVRRDSWVPTQQCAAYCCVKLDFPWI